MIMNILRAHLTWRSQSRLGEGFAPTLQLMTPGASSKASSYFKESRQSCSPVSSIKIHTDATGILKKLITRVSNNPSCDLVEHPSSLTEMQSSNEHTDKINSEHASPTPQVNVQTHFYTQSPSFPSQQTHPSPPCTPDQRYTNSRFSLLCAQQYYCFLLLLLLFITFFSLSPFCYSFS